MTIGAVFLAATRDHHRAGRLHEAEAGYRDILRADPNDAEVWQLLAVVLHQRGQEDEALACFRRAIAIDPDCRAADTSLGGLLEQRGDLEGAAICYRRAVKERARDAAAHHALGRVLHRQGAISEAVLSYGTALRLLPDLAEAHSDLGDALRQLGRIDESATACERAVALKPDLAEAHNNLGNALRELGKLASAATCYERALALRPDWAEVHSNLGNVLQEQVRLGEAIAHYEHATALNPGLTEVHCNLGNALLKSGRFAAAIAAYQLAVEQNVARPEPVVQIAHAKAELCDWRRAEAEAAQVLDILRRRPGAVPPWNLQRQRSTPADQLLCARQWSQKLASPRHSVFAHHRPTSSRKIRLGYLSADFRDHPVGQAIADTIERHDRADFEVAGYSYGPDDGSALRRRFEAAFDRFTDLRMFGDREAAERINSDDIDILIDLTGYTQHARPRILLLRPAPIQVNYLGFLGTIGADFIDYILVDQFIAPPSQQPFFSENLVQLAGCWWPGQSELPIAATTRSRREYALPDNGFVFCCFNAGYKLAPAVFDVWMRLMRAVSGSVFWLAVGDLVARDNLRHAAAARGIDPKRLVFAEREPMAEYLARHRHADLFLDSLPYNAVGTAYNALAAGLPVLTCAGDTFASRTAGTMLRAAGLPELVTASLAEYERLALDLAQSPEALRSIRNRLARARASAPLFDPRRLAADSEAAFRQMWKIRRAGEPPRPFSVGSAEQARQRPFD